MLTLNFIDRVTNVINICFRIHILQWNSICCLYDDNKKIINMIVNGDIFQYNSSLDILNADNENSVNDIILGTDESKSKNYRGRIAKFNMWNRALDLQDAIDWTLCKNWNNGNVFDWSRSSLDLINMQEATISDEVLCSLSTPGIIIVPEKMTYMNMKQFCNKLGGSIYSIPFESKINDLIDMIKSYSNTTCDPMKMLTAGYTDELKDGVFVGEDGQVLDKLGFKTGQPNGGRIENCAMVSTSSLKFHDVACDEDAGSLCGFCKLPEIPAFELRGDLLNIVVDRQYFWTREIYNGKYVFKGIQENELRYQKSKWIVVDSSDKQIIFLDTKKYPFGKSTWQVTETGIQLMLSFDGCTGKQFNCDDGNCIDIKQRCNGRYECLDQSDETNCSTAIIQPSYKKFVPPLSSKDTEGPLVIDLYYFSLVILDIIDTRSLMTIQFGLFSKWRDSRVKFVNLKENMNTTLIGDDASKLWTPTYTMYKTTEVNMIEDYSFQELFVKPDVPGLESDITDVEKRILFKGSEVDIFKRQWFRSDVICDFDFLEDFPFDDNVCSFQIMIHGTSMGWYLPLDNLKMNIAFQLKYKPFETGMYMIERQTVEITEEAGIFLVKVFLKRKFLSVFLQNALPSILLSIIVYMSNSYYKEKFEAAITVNVTCLLAMSGIFIAVFQSLPKTPSIKTIDLLQIKSILISTLITLLQTLVARIKNIEITELSKQAWREQPKEMNDTKMILFLDFTMMWFLPILGLSIDVLFIIFGILYENGIYSLSFS